MTRNLAFLIVVFFLTEGTCNALPIPENVKDIVTFIFVAGNDGELIPKGTGFFVGVRSPENTKRFFGYLVTAKHVIQKGISFKITERSLERLQSEGIPNNILEKFNSIKNREFIGTKEFLEGIKETIGEEQTIQYKKLIIKYSDKNDLFFTFLKIRLNKKGDGVGHLPVLIIPKGDNKTLFLHEDPTVDLAVIPLVPDQEKFEFKVLTEDFLVTKEDFENLHIREGSDIFFTGLFLHHIGENRNFPIVRFGRVALVTEEKIDWGGVKTELYLMESASYGGNSGSPVFFYLGAEREPGRIVVGAPTLKLAGVMKGSFL